MLAELTEEQRDRREESGEIYVRESSYRPQHELPVGSVLELHSLAKSAYDDEPQVPVERPPVIRPEPATPNYARMMRRSQWDEKRHRQIMRAFDPEYDLRTGPAVVDNHPAYGNLQQYAEPAEKPVAVSSDAPKPKPIFEDLLRECGQILAEQNRSNI